MTNFDPSKLKAFLTKNPDIETAIAKSVPEPKQEEGEHFIEKKESVFKAGHIIIIPSDTGANKEFRVRRIEGGEVVLVSLEESSGHSEIKYKEEELIERGAYEQPEKKNERTSHPPVQDLFTKFNKKQNYSTGGIIAWKKQWIDSGKIDEYRNSLNVSLENTSVEQWKKELDLYIQSLDKPSNISQEEAVSNIGIIAKILSGATDDDMWAAATYPPSGARLKDLQARLEGKGGIKTDAREKGETASLEKKPAFILGALSGWPSIIKRNEKKGTYTYTANGKVEDLPVMEWLEAEHNIKPVLDQYFKFLAHGGPSEQHTKMSMFGSLIAAKNDIIRALYDKDPGEGIIRAEVLRGHLVEAEKEWKEYVEKQKKKEEEIKEAEKNRKEEERVLRIPSAAAFDKENSWHIEMLNRRLRHLSGQLFPDETEGLQRKINALVKQKESILEHLKKVEEGGEEFKEELLEPLLKARTRLRIELGMAADPAKQILRPSINFTQARGSRISSKDIAKERSVSPELLAVHRRMYQDDPETYKNTYLSKSYIAGDSTKDAVITVLEENGFTIPTESQTIQKPEENKTLSSFRETYSPEKKKLVAAANFEPKSMARESYTRLQRDLNNLIRAKEALATKDLIAKLKAFNNERGGGFRDRNEEELYKLETMEHKLRISINKLSKISANHSSYSGEYDSVDREIQKYANRVEEFKNSLERQIEEMNTAHSKEEPSPESQEHEMEKKLQKVNALLEARKKHFESNPIYMKRGRIRGFLGALLLATAAGTAYDHFMNGGEPAPEPTIAASVPDIKATWERRVQTPEEKAFLQDFRSLPPEELIKKRLGSSNLDLPSEALSLNYDTLMSENSTIPFLSDEQRLELSKMVTMVEHFSQYLDAPAEEWAQKTGTNVSFNNDRFAKGWTLGAYFKEVRSKLAKIEQQKTA